MPAPSRRDLSERALGTLLLLPAAVLLAVIVVYPVATLIGTSLFTVDPENVAAGETFAGLGNYMRAFGDERFWHTTWNTVLYVVVTVPGALVVGLGLALLANRAFAIKWPVRLGLLLPWAMPLVFAGLIFRWFFEYDTGLVNNGLAALGIDPLPWLSSPTLAFCAIAIAIVWKASSFVGLVLLAGLQAIPRSLYEAADVDGASAWQQFVEITLPMLAPAIAVALIFRSITAIQTFDIPFAMTGGGPGDATETLAMYIHKTTLDFLDFGYGSALAVLMFVLSMAVTAGYLRYTYRSARRHGA